MNTTTLFAQPPAALRAGVLAVAAAFPMAALALPAARVEFAVGNPVALSASGQSRTLAKGAPVESGETVNTNAGRVQLRFSDGAYVSLQPQSEFRIDDYRYNGKTDGSERGLFSLFKGGLRTITGLIGRSNRKNYQVTTTVATIGIRGTEYTIAYTNSITGSVGDGEINVCTSVGCVPFGSGQSFIVTDANSRPKLTYQKSDLPPPQPGDPAGGVFQTANDPTKPNGIGSKPTYVSGDITNSDGEPIQFVFAGTQTTLTAGVCCTTFLDLGTNRTVVFDANGAATQIQGLTVYDLSSTTDVGNDGVIAWGRGLTPTTGQQYLHYVAGLPTTQSDISALQISQPVATYSLTGHTSPTGLLGTSNVVGTLLGASLVANFGAGTVGANVQVGIAGTTLTLSAPNMTMTTSPVGTTFQTFTFAGGCTVAGGVCSIGGLFAGTNAVRAGLVYDASATIPAGSLSLQGAAVFTKQ